MASSPDRVEADRRKAARPPTGYTFGDHPQFAVTCDIVIATMQDQRPHVLLVKRRSAPFAGWWALPGGFKHPDETLDETARRELLEETNVEAPSYLQQFRSYGDPNRDERGNVVTVAYLAVVPDVRDIVGGSDAVDAALHPIESVLDGSLDLAFDHGRIISDAHDFIADQLDISDLATRFVPQQFALSQLQSVYESFWETELDSANFRRNLLADSRPYVAPTKYVAESTPSGGRPPKLFKATRAWKDGSPPIRRRRRKSS